MHYTFLSQKLESLYSGDLKMLSLFFYFSIFVIFISGLGLYGLSSFLIEQRSKEIGIRKVLGGSERQITFMLARSYLKLVLLSALVASPLVYYLMSKWMDTFAYRIPINGWDFALGILITLSIAFANSGQHQDAGAKMVHSALNTSSRIISKSISKGGGRSSYRGLVKIDKGAYGCKSNVLCDALILDPESRSDTYPYIEIEEEDVDRKSVV